MEILTVCTGNICRSALAEAQLRSSLDPKNFTVASAGVAALVGGLVPEEQLRIGEKLGLTDLEDHRGRQITTDMVGRADLILVATLDHRAEVVRMLPSSAARTFTFREFAHLANLVTGEHLDELVAAGSTHLGAAVQAAAEMRGSVPLPRGEANEHPYDVADPYLRGRAQYERSAGQLAPAIEDIAKYLGIVARLQEDAGGP